MNYAIKDIEGIGPAYGEKLATVGIRNTSDFLEHCCHAKGRKEIATKTGLSEKLILRWANQADLMRISGVGPQFADLLEAAGVDTVKELRNRNAENLSTRLIEINKERKLVRSNPATSIVTGWITDAKSMEPTITH